MWVGIWAIYGKGVGAENLQSIAGFGAAFMSMVLVDLLVDIGILALDKQGRGMKESMAVNKRLYSAA